MSAVQLVSAHIGRVTGSGLASNLVAMFPRRAVAVLVAILLIANIINIGADLSAMAAAASLVAGGGEHVFVIAFALVSTLLQLFIPYHRYARVLKWLTLSLFAYVGVLLVVQVDWRSAGLGMVWPRRLGLDAVVTIVALLRHDDQPVSVLLAELAGGRGTGRRRRQAAAADSEAGRGPVPPNALRYAGGDGVFEPDRAGNHHRHRRDPQQQGRDDYQ